MSVRDIANKKINAEINNCNSFLKLNKDIKEISKFLKGKEIKNINCIINIEYE